MNKGSMSLVRAERNSLRAAALGLLVLLSAAPSGAQYREAEDARPRLTAEDYAVEETSEPVAVRLL